MLKLEIVASEILEALAYARVYHEESGATGLRSAVSVKLALWIPVMRITVLCT